MALNDFVDDEIKATNSDNLVTDLYFGTAEKTVASSSMVADSYYAPYNPDDLYQKAGDYSIYEDMLVDDQVSVAMQLKKDLVIGSGWNIVVEDDGQKEIADAIYSMLEEDPVDSFDDMLEELIHNSYSYGFALSEKLFRRTSDGGLTFKCLKTRHPASWLIHTDQYGNVEKFEQFGPNRSIDVNPKSLIHYTNSRSFQNPYGTSDLRAAYNAYFVKRHIIRYYSIFLEKAASPIPVAKYKQNLPKEKVADLHNIIKKFQTKTALTIPDAIMVDFLESKSNGEAYTKGINLFNMFIGRALFIPDLLGFSGSGSQSGGSQALGREQVDMFLKHIQRRRRTLERVVNKHIIQPLVVYNFGDIDFYPKFVLNPITEDDAVEYAKTFIQAMQGKLYKPTADEINHLRSLIKFPESDDVEFHEEAGSMPFAPAGIGGQQPPKPEEEGEEPEVGEPEITEMACGPGAKEQPKKFRAVYKAPAGEYANKTNVEKLRSALESAEAKVLAEAQPLIGDIFEDMFDQMIKKRIVSDQPKPDRIETIKLKKLKSLQVLLKKHLRQAYQDHRAIAQSELFKQNFSTPLPTEKFLEFLEAETFQFVGDWEYAVTKNARIAMMNAIRDGKPISSVIDLLDQQGKKDAFVSLERYSRTKFTEVMNRARIDQFEESRVVDGYQYSAILDDRTTEICRSLHGKKFKKGTEPIPPLHFGCRSVLIPITIFEEYTPDTKVGNKDINAFIEENKGKGFATR